MASIGIQTAGTSHQGYKGHLVYKSGRHSQQSNRPVRFGTGASSSSSGQSSVYDSIGSRPSAYPNFGRVH